MVRSRGLEPPRDCSRCHLKAVRLPIPPRPRVVQPVSQTRNVKLWLERPERRSHQHTSGHCFSLADRYFFCCAGLGVAGALAGAFEPWRSRTGAAEIPAPRVATIDNEIDVTINTIAEIVVAFDNSVAEPRGPKAVCEPMPPKAPARSAAFPLCSRTTMIRKRHTIT